MVENKEDQLDLEGIIDEATKPGEGKVITLEDKPEEKVVGKESNQPTPEETIAELRGQLEATKVRETEARAIATRLEGERTAEVKKATSALDEVYRARETSVESAIAAATSDLASVKRQLKEAREKGDIDAETELNDRLADVRYQLNAVNWQKNALATEKKQREDVAKAAIIEGPATQKFTPREQAWIEANPRYNTDDDFQSYVWSVDALAKKKGIVPNTDAYFEFLEARVKKMFPEEQSGEAHTIRKAAPASSTAAPATRSGENSRIGQNGRQVKLTADQLEAAEFMGMAPVEYAQDLINQEKEKTGRA